MDEIDVNSALFSRPLVGVVAVSPLASVVGLGFERWDEADTPCSEDPMGCRVWACP
jgi:hypothetical protein